MKTSHVAGCQFYTRGGHTDCPGCRDASGAVIAIHKLADEYRKKHRLPSHGYVIFYAEEPCGWTYDRSEPSKWRPGCVAVGWDGVWWAEGGTYQNGSERWVAR